MRKKTEKIIAAVEAVLKKFEPMFKEHGGGAELVAVDEGASSATARAVAWQESTSASKWKR